MRTSERGRAHRRRRVVVYVIILVAFQVFLITVAVEAFQTDNESLAWATAACRSPSPPPRPPSCATSGHDRQPTAPRPTAAASTRSRRCSPATSRS